MKVKPKLERVRILDNIRADHDHCCIVKPILAIATSNHDMGNCKRNLKHELK